MKYGIIIFVLLFSAITVAFAQPSGEIYYINESGNRSDTIDFDVVFYKNTTSVRRNVILNNTGKIPLQIATKFSPDFAIKRVNFNTLENNEFNPETSTPFPFIVQPNTKDSITILYTPQNDTSANYPLGERKAQLELRLTAFGDPGTPVVDDTFHLTVLKTKDYLAARREILDFDSVYVGVIDTARKDLIVKNTRDQDVNVTTQRFTQLVTRFKQEFFTPTGIDSFTFIGLTNKTFPIRFSPFEIGLDSARYSVIYAPNIDNQIDSVSVLLRGVGVQQIIQIDNQTSASPGAAQISSADIVSISNSAQIGDSVILSLVIRNRGNIPFGIDSQSLTGKNTDQFYILKKFRDDHDLRPKSLNIEGELDTAIIIFKPKESGSFTVDYEIGSNIRSRIASAPDSSKKRTIHIVASAAKPTLVLRNVTNNTILIDSVFLPIDKSCPVQEKPFRLVMSNIGNAPLKINSVVVRPIGTFSTTPPDGEIPANQERPIDITFSPADSGEYTAELLISTNSAGNSNEPSDTVRIRLIGRAINAPFVSLSFPTKVTARAGRKILIPIIVSKSIGYVKKIGVNVIFEDTLGLDFVRTVSIGTASEGAAVSPIRNGNSLQLTVTAADKSLLPRDTLIFLEFDTFLSPLELSSLSLVDPKAGNESCASIFRVDPTGGVFGIDSLCGTTYRQVLNAGAGYQLRSFASNPTDQIAFIEYSLPYTSKTTVKMFTTFGAEVSTVAEGIFEPGTYRAAVSVSDLPPGVYYCVMQSGLFHTMQTIVVTR